MCPVAGAGPSWDQGVMLETSLGEQMGSGLVPGSHPTNSKPHRWAEHGSGGGKAEFARLQGACRDFCFFKAITTRLFNLCDPPLESTSSPKAPVLLSLCPQGHRAQPHKPPFFPWPTAGCSFQGILLLTTNSYFSQVYFPRVETTWKCRF